MKKFITLSFCGIIALSSCQKSVDVAPVPSAPVQSVVPASSTTSPVVKLDTMPDGAILKIRIQLDSAQLDETLLRFNHGASINYTNSQDAVYFSGFGMASLSSISYDGIPCAIQTLPYQSNSPIHLKVGAKKDGIYLLTISYLKNIPQDKEVWLKDAYKKDSLNLRRWNYRFNVYKADTSSYGARRFTVVLR